MCSSIRKFALFGLLAIVAIIAPTAWAGVGAGITPSYPSPVAVGNTSLTVTMDIVNLASAPDSTETMTSIHMYTGCKASGFPCAAGNQEPGVITFSAGATGVVTGGPGGGEASCTGAWTIAVDGAGLATFTPTGGTLTLTNINEKCTLTFTMNVAAAPAAGSTTNVSPPGKIVFGPADMTVAGNSTPGTFDQTGGTATVVQACSATIDKQVSCNGTGGTFYDAADLGSPVINGCVAAFGAAVNFKYVVTNTGDAAITCSTGVVDPGQTITNGTITALATTLSQTATSSLTCTQTSSGAVQDTASLSGCTCTEQSQAITAGTNTDTAEHACVGVQIDKQITDITGASTPDTNFELNNEDGTKGFIAFTGNNVSAKWLVKSLGDLDLACELKETNTNLSTSGGFPTGIKTSFAVTQNTSSQQIAATSPLECMAARGALEPNTADLVCHFDLTGTGLSDPNSLNCAALTGDPADFTGCAVSATAGGINTSMHVRDIATFDCCGVAIDKLVSCNGSQPTDPTGCVTSPPTLAGGPPATNVSSCSEALGLPLTYQFKVQNTGSLNATCNFIDTPNSGSPVTIAGITIGGGQTSCSALATIPDISTTCSSSGPDTASLVTPTGFSGSSSGCTCTSGATTVQIAAVSDKADVLCNPPTFNLTKTCDPVTPGANTFTSNVTVTSGAASPALDCTVIDQTVAGACANNQAACSNVNGVPTFGVAGTTVSLLSANPISVPGAGGQTTDSSAGGAIGPLSSAVCNQACGVCSTSGIAADGSSPVNSFAATCTPPGASCFARTPGYWAEHPHIAQEVIDANGGSIPNCGINITTSQASPSKTFINNSSTEDLCSIGTDDKKFYQNVDGTGQTLSTTSQQMQLIRQCMSAQLNLVASAKTTGPAFNCEDAFPSINEIYGACCGVNSLCSNGTATAVDCLTALDSFNGSFENTPNPPNFPEESADSQECRDAKNNKFANFGSGRTYPPGK